MQTLLLTFLAVMLISLAAGRGEFCIGYKGRLCSRAMRAFRLPSVECGLVSGLVRSGREGTNSKELVNVNRSDCYNESNH